MKYFTIIYLFICYSSGFACFTIGILLYLKYRLEEIKYFLYFFLTITFIITVIGFNFYYKSVFFLNGTNLYNLIFFGSLLIGDSFYIYTFPYFIFRVLKKNFIKKRMLAAIALLPAVSCLILNVINLFARISFDILKISVYFACLLLVASIIYIFCLILYNLKGQNDPLRKKALKLILFFIVLYSPFAVVDSFYDYFMFIFRHLPDGFSFSAPYYFILNLVCLLLAGRYLLAGRAPERDLSEVVLDKYNVTAREREVAIFIMKGMSNKQISDKAFISMTTVKTHIYNLFQKTGARNRVELINILKGQN